MTGELDIYGVFISPLLAWGVVALIATAVLRRVLAFAGFYRLVWHRALVDLALFVIVLGAVAAFLPGWIAQ